MKNHQLFIYFICLVSAMGGLLFGYDWVVIGGAKPFYEEYFHIAGNEGMQALTMSIALLGLSYFFEFKGFIMIVFVVLAIGFYAMSLGPVTWVLLSEIFPNKVRGVAMAVCTAALWVASFLLTYTFPFLNSGLGTGGTFLLYAVICFCGFLFVWRRIPETKGKSLEELEKELIK